MIRSPLKTQPVYREVVTHALRTAWYDRRYWPLSLFAGILFTGGAYDVLLKAATSISDQSNRLIANSGATLVERVTNVSASAFDQFVVVVGGLEMLVAFTLIILAVAALSCVAQGGLIYALGARRRGECPTLKQAIRIGAGAIRPVFALNAMSLATLWVLRFLAALPLFISLEHTEKTVYLMYLVSFCVFVPLSFIVFIVQIFALNAMILQGASLPQALHRGIELFRRHWVISIETALVQTVLSMVLWLAFSVVVTLLLFPSFALMFGGFAVGSVTLFGTGLMIGAVIGALSLLFIAAFSFQLQYATWTYLYRRLGEGGVIPKLHRIVRTLFNTFSVKS